MQPSLGPTSKKVELPPPKKPGRKAATDEPTSKRALQNRNSQRVYRKKRLEKLESLDKQVTELTEQNRELEVANYELEAENQRVKTAYADLDKSFAAREASLNETWSARLMASERKYEHMRDGLSRQVFDLRAELQRLQEERSMLQRVLKIKKKTN